MTFEQILPALRQGKKVRRKGYGGRIRYIEKSKSLLPFHIVRIDREYDETELPECGDIYADDWEIAEDEQQKQKKEKLNAAYINGYDEGFKCGYNEGKQALYNWLMYETRNGNNAGMVERHTQRSQKPSN